MEKLLSVDKRSSDQHPHFFYFFMQNEKRFFSRPFGLPTHDLWIRRVATVIV